MKFPASAAAAGRAALAARYGDAASVSRLVRAENRMVGQTIYEAAPCHLSIDKTAPHQQGETGSVALSYTLRLPVAYEILPGDALTVVHHGVTYKGTAGLPVRGNLSVVIPMDGVKIV